MKSLWIAAASTLLTIAAIAESLPLPLKTDIPADFSTVICPNAASAQRMLREFHVPGDNWLDSAKFMEGLRITGCDQNGGPLQIVEVVERKQIAQEGDYIYYRGKRPSGETVFGIVHEQGNNQQPRSSLERWLRLHAPGGNLFADPSEKRTYVCPTPDAASKVVASIPPAKEKGVNQPQQVKARDAAIKARKCVLANGNYRVTAVHGNAFISLGYEAGQDWTALTATDANGATVGLLHDASVM